MVLLIVAVGRGGPRLRSMEGEARATALRLERALATEQALLTAAAIAPVDAPAVDELAVLRSRLLRASSPLAVAAATQRAVALAARSSGLELTGSSAIADPAFLNRIETIGVRFTAVGTTRQLAQWLSLIGSGDALVRVRELTVAQSNVHAEPDIEVPLQITVLVEALASADSATGAAQ